MRRRPHVAPRPALRAALAALLGLALCVGAAVLVRPGVAAADERPPLVALEREVRDITLRLSHVADQLTRLEVLETELSALVDALKNRPPGVVRDAQLQDALKRLRTVLASKRELVRRQRILQITLAARKAALRKAARHEAALHAAQGRELVLMGDDAAGRKAFAESYDLLILGEDVTGPQPPPTDPDRLPLPVDDLPLRGDEWPDELREMGMVLRDSAEKARAAAAALEADLSRLQTERATLERLAGWVPSPPPSGDGIRARLDDHIGRLARHIELLHTHFAGLMARASELDERAKQEERALLSGARQP